MDQAQRPARVEERGDEQQAERQPDVGCVDLLGDGAGVAAGERSLDLVVAPRLVDVAGGVEDDQRDLLATRPVGDLPTVAADVRGRGRVRALRELVSDDVGGVRADDRLAGRDLEARRWHRLGRRLDQGRRLLAAERRLVGGVVLGDGARGSEQRQRERDDGRRRAHGRASLDGCLRSDSLHREA
jgi:hypothetical protein